LSALATDFDGTLAHHETVSAETIAALQRLKTSGFKLILITGRELNELMGIFPELSLFDLAVMENGAMLYEPSSRGIKLLGEPPPGDFIGRLHDSGIPLQVGRVIVATWEQHTAEVVDAVRNSALPLQIIYNKDAVMILPKGINKASGLHVAVTELGLTPLQVVGVGDAENDEPFLKICGFSVAVANALPTVKDQVDLVTTAGHGDGVSELIHHLLSQPETFR